MGNTEESFAKFCKEMKGMSPDFRKIESLPPMIDPSARAVEQFREAVQRQNDALEEFENPFPDMIEQIRKANQECAEQIKALNESNAAIRESNANIKAELEKSNHHIAVLEEKLQKIQDSHKHDTRNAILLTLLGALSGSVVAWIFQIDWIAVISMFIK